MIASIQLWWHRRKYDRMHTRMAYVQARYDLWIKEATYCRLSDSESFILHKAGNDLALAKKSFNLIDRDHLSILDASEFLITKYRLYLSKENLDRLTDS